MKTTLFICCFLLLLPAIHAQKSDAGKTTLHLNNGSVLEGQIIAENAEQIHIRLFGGHEVKVNPLQVEKREEGKAGRRYFPDGRWVTVKGYYSRVQFNVSLGKDDTPFTGSDVLSGIKLQSIHGYKFNRYLSLGLSLGFHSFEMPTLEESEPNYFNTSTNFTVFPIELDFRGLILDDRISPYYALNVGYGIAIFKNGEPKNRKGGLSGQLEAGVSFAGRKTGSFHIGMGYLIQDLQATYTINRFGGDLRFIDVDNRIHRFILNFGWGF